MRSKLRHPASINLAKGALILTAESAMPWHEHTHRAASDTKKGTDTRMFRVPVARLLFPPPALKGLLVGLLSAALLYSLAACNASASGGTQRGSTTAASPTLGSDIASQLRQAQPQDFTYTSEQSDANASHGTKIGEGVETRNPDLLYQKFTISSGGQSYTSEQMIDYPNAVAYQRLSSAAKWDRVSAKIAHYYDLQNPKVLGTETLNRVLTYHIRGTAVNDGQAFTIDVWARTDSLYPAQIWEKYTPGTPQGSYYLFIVTAYNTGATLPLPTAVAP